MKRRLIVVPLAIILSVAASSKPAAAQYSRAALQGKSLLQLSYGFISGGTDVSLGLVYRAAPMWDVTAAFETATAGGTSAGAFSVGVRYHFMAEQAPYSQADPYFLAGFGAIAAISATSLSAGTGWSAGLGSDLRITDTVEGFGSVGFSSVTGTTNFAYGAGLRLDLSEKFYAALGISGAGSSSAFFVGLGTRF